MVEYVNNSGFSIKGHVNMSDGSSIEITKDITSVSINYSYFTNVFPLYLVEFRATPSVNSLLINGDFDISLVIEKFDMDEENISDSENKFINGVVENVRLRVYDKSVEFVDGGGRIDDEEDNPVKGIVFEVAGIPESSVSANKNIQNQIYRTLKMENVIVSLLNDINLNEVQIDPLREDIRMPQYLLVPPLNITNSIKFLHENYGLYYSPMNLFFERDRLDIFEMDSRISNHNNILSVKVHEKSKISENTEADVLNQIMVNEENDNLKLNIDEDPLFINTEKVDYSALGSTTLFARYNDLFELDLKETQNENAPYEQKQFYWNSSTMGEFFREYTLRTLSKPRTTTSLKIASVDHSKIDIRTLINIQSLNKKFAGNYSVLSKTVLYQGNDNGQFSNELILEVISI